MKYIFNTKTALLSLASFVLIMNAGCAIPLIIGGAAVGAGTVVYIKGQIEETVNSPAPIVYNAAISALKSMNMPILSDEHDVLTANIKSSFSDGKNVWISIDALTSTSASLTVRVGSFGDEQRSRYILAEIQKQLKAPQTNQINQTNQQEQQGQIQQKEEIQQKDLTDQIEQIRQKNRADQTDQPAQ